MSDFRKPKKSWRKNRKNENRFQSFQRLPLGYTITEYELPTPSGAGDYSWRDLKSDFLRGGGGSGPLSMGSPLKMAQVRLRFRFFRFQISAAIIFDPRGSWKLIFGDCVSQGHSFKLLEPIFIFPIFSPRIFDFWKSGILKNPKFRPITGFPIVTKTRKSSPKRNFRFFGVSVYPGPHCSDYYTF